jgi:hypothetical protein
VLSYYISTTYIKKYTSIRNKGIWSYLSVFSHREARGRQVRKLLVSHNEKQEIKL